MHWPIFGRPNSSYWMSPALLLALQRPDANLLRRPVSWASVSSALMSLILKVTLLRTTSCSGSLYIIATGAQAWQMPNQVAMQKPESLPRRFAHTSPSSALHWLSVVQAVWLDWLSMPFDFETA